MDGSKLGIPLGSVGRHPFPILRLLSYPTSRVGRADTKEDKLEALYQFGNNLKQVKTLGFSGTWALMEEG